MPDKPFDPQAPKRLNAAVTQARLLGTALATVRTDDLAELLERDDYAETTRLQLAEACATLRQHRNDARLTAITLAAYMRIAGINHAELAAILSRTPDEVPGWLLDHETTTVTTPEQPDSAAHLAAQTVEREEPPARPAPPILEFETPACSICGEATEYTDKTFRCDDCGCQWPRGTAHLYVGTWDNPTAEQCPDVLEDADGLAIAQCIRTAGHTGDHIQPEAGEWIPGGEEG